MVRKKLLFGIGIIVLLLLFVYLIRNISNDYSGNADSVVAGDIKEYSYTNETLSPVKVEFKADIDIKQNSDGQYYINNAKYQAPVVINVKEDSFQIDSTSEEIIDNESTYVVTATGNFVKDGNFMGTKSVSSYYYLNASTGKITVSDM